MRHHRNSCVISILLRYQRTLLRHQRTLFAIRAGIFLQQLLVAPLSTLSVIVVGERGYIL